jgi:hypothetical protein
MEITQLKKIKITATEFLILELKEDMHMTYYNVAKL